MPRGDIFLVGLPASNQREERGKRPAIAVQADGSFSPMLMIVPFTSSLNAVRFDFTVKVKPSSENGLTLPSVAMIFQMRAIDPKRFIRKIGKLEPAYMDMVEAEIWKMLKPPNL